MAHILGIKYLIDLVKKCLEFSHLNCLPLGAWENISNLNTCSNMWRFWAQTLVVLKNSEALLIEPRTVVTFYIFDQLEMASLFLFKGEKCYNGYCGDILGWHTWYTEWNLPFSFTINLICYLIDLFVLQFVILQRSEVKIYWKQ